MSHSLEKHWTITRERLDHAYKLLATLRSDEHASRCYVEYRDFIDHNELECALAALEAVGEWSALPDEALEGMAVAAESMDLAERAAALRRQKVNHR